MQFSLEPEALSVSGVQIAVGDSNYFEIGYATAQQLFYIDRSKSGNTTFNENFKKASRFEKIIPLQKEKIQVQIYFDNSIAEVFVNGGEAAFTAQLFPNANDKGIVLFSKGGKSKFGNVTVQQKTTVW